MRADNTIRAMGWLARVCAHEKVDMLKAIAVKTSDAMYRRGLQKSCAGSAKGSGHGRFSPPRAATAGRKETTETQNRVLSRVAIEEKKKMDCSRNPGYLRNCWPAGGSCSFVIIAMVRGSPEIPVLRFIPCTDT